MQELRFSFQPKQRQFLETVDNVPVTFYGGAKGGGKSYSLRNIILLRRFKYPGSVGAIFRKSYPELEANHISKMFEEHPQLRQYYNESKKLLSLPNGSYLRFCYCENDGDVTNYQGQEIHDLGIDEAGQWTEAMFRTLHGSNRSSSPNIKPRCMLTGNPGGIGHSWLKRLFITRAFKARERSQDYAFIQALVDDNAALMDNDPDYIYRLEAETNEALRKAYRHGDWDILAGQFFSEIRRDIHFIKPFNIPYHWNRFGAYDFGFNHPASFGWFANDEDGNVYLYRELIKPRTRIDQFAREILLHDDTKRLYPIVAGHDCWARKGQYLNKDSNPPTIAEEFAKQGIHLKQAVIDRIQGANQLRKYLAWEGRPDNKPRFYIFDTCPVSFDCITRMIQDPDRMEDVLKVDSDNGDINSGDDPYDMVRYGLMSRPMLTDTPKVYHPHGSEEWAKQEVTKMEQAAEEHFTDIEQADKGFGWT